MKTNSIDNFIAGNRPTFVSAGQKPSDIEIITTRKEKPHFDINTELNNRTFIRPLPPKGHIIKSNILTAPRDFVDDLKTDIKALKSAWKGDANDHQLGKLNDLGMKAGGLAIAAYLFTMRHTPVTKAMEFVGLTSFFASMAIWPKIALDIPARLIHGFSPFMRYEDSQGRKKEFFQDNQYIPFDMLSDKDIDRIGKRLGVPKHQVNYREAVEEKARQIALQNHTMLMLTVGFATPILSSLICNFAEPYVDDAYSYFMNKRVDNIAEHFRNESKKFKTDTINKNINDLLLMNNGKPITKEVISDIARTMTPQLGPTVRKAIEADLGDLFVDGTYKITPSQLNTINARIKSIITSVQVKLPEKVLNGIIPTEEQITALFTDNGYLNKNLTELEIQKIGRDIKAVIAQNYIKAATENGEPVKERVQIRLSAALDQKVSSTNAQTLQEVLKANPANILDEAAQSTIKSLASTISDLNADHIALHEYSYRKLAQAPSTAKAKYWNDAVNSIVKTLNITPKEIESTRYDRKLVGELINRKVWEFATSSPADYKKFIEKLAYDIAQIDIHVKPSYLMGQFLTQAESVYESSARTLRATNLFTKTADSIVRADKKEAGTLYGITKSFIESNVNNLSSTFSAILNKANVFRTLYKNPDLAFIGAKDLPKEVKEEMVGLIEYLTTEGRISDYSVKFDFPRNLTPHETEGNLEFSPNKGIKYAYYNAEKRAADGVMIKSDINFFRRVINAMFKTPVDMETTAALSKFSIVGDMLTKYRTNMGTMVANLENFMYPETVMEVFRNKSDHDIIIKDATYSSATPKQRSNAVGAALDEVFTNTLRQSYNTRKWLKTFGTFGAGLFGITLLSQFLFGHGNSGKIKKDKA